MGKYCQKKHKDPYYLAIDDLDNRNLGSDFLLDKHQLLRKKEFIKYLDL